MSEDDVSSDWVLMVENAAEYLFAEPCGSIRDALTTAATSTGADLDALEREFRLCVNEWFDGHGNRARLIGDQLYSDGTVPAGYYWALDRYESISVDALARITGAQ